MTIEAKLEMPVAVGQRVVVNVSGGTVRGPKINGDIIAPAGDSYSPCRTDQDVSTYDSR
jgi:hypothetical protein